MLKAHANAKATSITAKMEKENNARIARQLEVQNQELQRMQREKHEQLTQVEQLREAKGHIKAEQQRQQDEGRAQAEQASRMKAASDAEIEAERQRMRAQVAELEAKLQEVQRKADEAQLKERQLVRAAESRRRLVSENAQLQQMEQKERLLYGKGRAEADGAQGCCSLLCCTCHSANQGCSCVLM